MAEVGDGFGRRVGKIPLPVLMIMGTFVGSTIGVASYAAFFIFVPTRGFDPLLLGSLTVLSAVSGGFAPFWRLATDRSPGRCTILAGSLFSVAYWMRFSFSRFWMSMCSGFLLPFAALAILELAQERLRPFSRRLPVVARLVGVILVPVIYMAAMLITAKLHGEQLSKLGVREIGTIAIPVSLVASLPYEFGSLWLWARELEPAKGS